MYNLALLDRRWGVLRGRLLAVGGRDVFVKWNISDRDLRHLIRYGRFWSPGETTMSLKGPKGLCHLVSTQAFLQNDFPGAVVWFGFALGGRGIWDQHTWLMKGDQIIEPVKGKIERYYGVPLPPSGARAFALDVWEGHDWTDPGILKKVKVDWENGRPIWPSE